MIEGFRKSAKPTALKLTILMDNAMNMLNSLGFRSAIAIGSSILSVSAAFADDAAALADSARLTETLADRLNCTITSDREIGKDFQDCNAVTKGKYSFSLNISPNTLQQLGFAPGQIDDTSVIDIAVGDFWFNAALAEANRRKVSADGRTVFAAWNGFHEACIKTDASSGECLGTKNVRDTVVSLNIDAKGMSLNVAGDSVLDFYGAAIFAYVCDSYGEGVNAIGADFSVLLANVDITDRLEVNCNVAYRESDKGDSGHFYLRNMKIGAKWSPSDLSFAKASKSGRQAQ
jgi:hypothetical protein